VIACGKEEQAPQPEQTREELRAEIEAELRAELTASLRIQLESEIRAELQPAREDIALDESALLAEEGTLAMEQPLEGAHAPAQPAVAPHPYLHPESGIAGRADEAEKPAEEPREKAPEPPVEAAAETPPAVEEVAVQPSGTLEVVRLAVAPEVNREERAPVGASESFDANEVSELYSYAVIRNRGPETKVTIEWAHQGVTVSRVELTVGHSLHGWRTWGKVRVRPQRRGQWTTRVLESSGAVLEQVDFTIL
jgi:hypothetical protein